MGVDISSAPGEISCSALDWNPLHTIGHWVIGKDHALIESSGEAYEFTHWAAHVELQWWHHRPHFYHPDLYEANWLNLLRCGKCGHPLG